MTASPVFKVLGIAQIALAVLLVAGVLTFAGPCVHEDGSAATCAQASWGIIGMGVMLLGASIAQLVVEGKVARIATAVLCAILGVIIILVPGTILPLCMMETMSCQAVMKPFAQLCGGLTILLSIATAVVAARR